MHKQQPRQKKGDTTFDVTMGSYDGAETCELRREFSNCKTSTSTSDFAETTDWPFPTPHREIQKTSKRKYAASLIIMDYGSPSKPTNRPSTS